jgi:hypothetical protein
LKNENVADSLAHAPVEVKGKYEGTQSVLLESYLENHAKRVSDDKAKVKKPIERMSIAEDVSRGLA